MPEQVIDESPKLWTKNYIVLLITNLFLCLGFYMLSPTIATYVLERGGSGLEASLSIGFFATSALFFRIAGGFVSDKIGEKLIALLGLAIMIGATVSYLFLPVTGIILMRAVQGAGWGIGTSAVATAVSRSVCSERRGEGIGYYSLTMIAAMALTPIAAIIVMNRYRFDTVVFVSVTMLVVGSLSAKFFKGTKPELSGEIKLDFKVKNLIEKTALLPSLLCFLMTITICGVMSYMMQFGREIGMQDVWVFFVGFVASILATRSFIGKIYDRKGHKVIVIPGAACLIAGLIILSFSRSAPMMVVASLLYGLGYGAVQPSLQAWAVSRASQERKGAANGTFLSSIDLGYAIGSVLLGFIAGHSGYAFMYRISSVFVIALLAIYAFKMFQKRPAEKVQLDKTYNTV